MSNEKSLKQEGEKKKEWMKRLKMWLQKKIREVYKETKSTNNRAKIKAN